MQLDAPRDAHVQAEQIRQWQDGVMTIGLKVPDWDGV
jgi:hypothetical protein